MTTDLFVKIESDIKDHNDRTYEDGDHRSILLLKITVTKFAVILVDSSDELFVRAYAVNINKLKDHITRNNLAIWNGADINIYKEVGKRINSSVLFC